ncbi:MAG TPA: hypothetical protein VIW73_07755 [Candidatus Cybelea sp.]
MRTSARYTLSLGAVAGLLAGCGSRSNTAIVPPAERGIPSSFSHNQTFHCTFGEQSFQVPAGVKAIAVVARGGAGDGSGGGKGARVYAVIPVHSGEILYVFVGAGGSYSGAYNGGAGAGGGLHFGAFGGGGASDVREGGDAVRDRILVAAGGGGQGGFGVENDGGIGGGFIGGAGAGGVSQAYGGGGGAGGTQRRGGSGGAGGIGPGGGRHDGQPGISGRLWRGRAGGKGGFGCVGHCQESRLNGEGGGGGGGGGGYYGGGGGGGGGGVTETIHGGPGGGGGGGSSYVEPRAKDVHMWPGWKKAGIDSDGQIVFSW